MPRRIKKRKKYSRKIRKKSVFRKKMSKEKKALVSTNYDYVLQYLLEHPCVQCGEKDIVVLEFDHIDPTKKRATISQLLDKSLDVVKAEIEKCQVLCCNCHRRRTAKQHNWKRRLALSEQMRDE